MSDTQTENATVSKFAKYRNPDKRCKYPFEPSPIGYCWGYANYIDGHAEWQDIQRACRMCAFYDKGTSK